jgi:hypothetical protein
MLLVGVAVTQLHEGRTVTDLMGLVDELTYRNYAHNRMLSPHISPERWQKAYGDTAAMEKRFHAEQFPSCPCVDATGLYVCNQPSTVYRTDYESPMCAKCDKERP